MTMTVKTAYKRKDCMMKEFIDELAQRAKETIAEPTDYLNEEDNLRYCANCHTPKQTRLSIPLPNGEYVVSVPCACQTKAEEERKKQMALSEHYQLVDRLRSQGIRDRKIRDWKFANDDGTTPLLEKAKKYVENFEEMRKNNVGLLLWGDVGTGKSFFAGCIANALIEKEISVCMTNFSYILADMTNLQIDKNQYIQNLNNKSLLIIDDFGMERNTSFALEQLYNVIDSRYTASKPIIITTNLTLLEIENTDVQTDYRRIYDRVLEMCVPIQFKGKSKREEKAEQKFNIAKKLLD